MAGDGDGGAAILVQSDSLQSIENSGVIAMATESLVEGASVEALALDARTQTAGLTLRQYDADTSDTATPSITGNVRLGSGADTVRLEAGALNGDLFFGDGDDNFVLRNANFGGALSDTDGRPYSTRIDCASACELHVRHHAYAFARARILGTLASPCRSVPRRSLRCFAS